jgi:hypothetical protein
MKDLDDYMAALNSLQQKYRAGDIEEVEFSAVVRDTDRYVGKVVRSEVTVINGNLRGIIAAAGPSAAARDVLLLASQDSKVGNLVQALLPKVGNRGRLWATYGVCSSGNVILYNAATAPTADNDNAASPAVGNAR